MRTNFQNEMKTYIILMLLIVSHIISMAQVNSRNGYYHSAHGTIRVFVVFAEAINDTDERGKLGDWLPGEMPPDADTYLDYEFTTERAIEGYLTKYFYEASFGNYIFIGDYYPELVQIEFSTISGDGTRQVADYLNNLHGNDVLTAHGLSLNNDFDSWTPAANNGNPKINSPDNYIDVFMVLWRNNSSFRPERNGDVS